MSEIQIKCPKCSADLLIDKDEYEALQGTTISCLDCNADIVLPSRPIQSGSAPKFCSSCGASIPLNTKFCTKCGAKVNGAGIERNQVPEPIKPRLAVTPIRQQTSFPTNSIYSGPANRKHATQTSTLAIFSLALGILGIFIVSLEFFGIYNLALGIVRLAALLIAIISGHIAKYRIKISDGSLNGNSIARAGLILGYTPLLFILICTLMVFTPSFVKAKQESQTSQCVNHLREIEAAKEQWALATRHDTGDPVDVEAAMKYIRNPQEVLKCPAGGTIDFNVVGTNATCTIPGHVLPN